MVLLNEPVECEVGKEACIRNANKEQYLLDGKSRYCHVQNISGIESPDPHFSKYDIPDEENEGRNHNGRKDIFPFFGEVGSAIETAKKGEGKGENIYPEIKIFRF